MTNSYPSGTPGASDTSMPTGAPGHVPRRSSYASVVSGMTQQPLRSGAFAAHHASHHPSASFDLSYRRNLDYQSDLRDYGHFETVDSVRRRSGTWGARRYGPYDGSFSWHSRAFAAGYAAGTANAAQKEEQPGDQFFIPSYLQGSRYVQQLEEEYKAKPAPPKDGASAPSSQPGSLSTSTSSVNLHAKMAPSHRGMTFDLIEKVPPVEVEGLGALPSKWNTNDKYAGLEVLSDGAEVKFTGSKASGEHEAASIRADHPMPQQCGIYYFEATIITPRREECSIGIGFSTKKVNLSRPPGWEPESWAYHGDDGHAYSGQSAGKDYGSPFSAGDTIGCGVNFRTGTAFFTRNGVYTGGAFREIKGKLYPSIGMRKPSEHIRVNFGQTPFVYDIDGMMSREIQLIKKEIEETSTEHLAPPLNETELCQSLVFQFLQHEGYVETAQAFAGEINSEREALHLDPNSEVRKLVVRKDKHAINRHQIRGAIMEGDIDQALSLMDIHYPQVLLSNEHVYFRLKCRKFIEMTRHATEIENASSSNGKKSNGHAGDWFDEILNNDMELDDTHGQQPGDGMEGVDTGESQPTEGQVLLQEALEYGQSIQAEFKDDPRREVHRALEQAFSLMAYQDPINAKEVSHLLDPSGRDDVAEELNSAILVSLGKNKTAALERLIQQTTILLEDLSKERGPGAFINIDDYTHPQ